MRNQGSRYVGKTPKRWKHFCKQWMPILPSYVRTDKHCSLSSLTARLANLVLMLSFEDEMNAGVLTIICSCSAPWGGQVDAGPAPHHYFGGAVPRRSPRDDANPKSGRTHRRPHCVGHGR